MLVEGYAGFVIKRVCLSRRYVMRSDLEEMVKLKRGSFSFSLAATCHAPPFSRDTHPQNLLANRT